MCPNKEMQLVNEHMDKSSTLFSALKYVYNEKEVNHDPLLIKLLKIKNNLNI